MRTKCMHVCCKIETLQIKKIKSVLLDTAFFHLNMKFWGQLDSKTNKLSIIVITF